MILLGLRESALLCQGLLFEPKASSAPGTMILADSRSLSSIRRRSPARTDATSPAETPTARDGSGRLRPVLNCENVAVSA